MASVAKTENFGIGKGGSRSCDIPDWIKNSPKYGKVYKESNGKTHLWCEGNRGHALRWVIHKPEDCCSIKKK